MFDGKAFGIEVVDMVRGYVDQQTAPLIARIADLEQKLVEAGAGIEMLQSLPDRAEVEQVVAEAIAALPAPKDEPVIPLCPRVEPEDIAALVAEAAAALPIPQDGKSFTAEDAAPLIAEEVAKAVAAIPAAEPGKDADPEAVREIVRAEVAAVAPKPEDIERQVAERVQAAVAELPPAKDGENGKDADPEAIELMVAQAVAALPLPRDGKDADISEVTAGVVAALEPIIAEQVAGLEVDMEKVGDLIAAEVAKIPAPQDGKGVTAEDVAPLIAEEVQRAVSALPAPKDGVGVAGAVIDREGSLILTLTNGETRDLGGVVGRDADMDSIARRIEELVSEIPRPMDGKDGFSLDSFDTELKEDGRTLLLKFVSGDTTETHELCFPLGIDRGVYKAETEYVRGDGVTWGGSFWIAQRDTSEKPETSDAWRLAVKKGRDGKDTDPAIGLRLIETKFAEAEAALMKRVEAFLKSKGL